MPLIEATGAGVRHRSRWVFRDLDVAVDPGEIVAVAGPPGSGRTTVLLSLVKRFRLTTGTVAVGGRTALGHVPDVEQPEPTFTVAEHVRERLTLLGRPRRDADDVIAGGLLGLDPRSKGWELTPYERQVLGLVLALLERPQIIALDGVDDGLNAHEQAALWVELERIAETGVALLVSAREVEADRVATIIHLDRARRPAGAVASVAPPDSVRTERPRRADAVTDVSAPGEDTPIEDVSADDAPAGTAPVGTAPAGTAPAGTAPAGTAPAGTAPAGSAPASTAPAGPAPARSTPASTAPARHTPAETAPVRSAAVERAPAESAAIGTVPPKKGPRGGAAPADAAPPEREPADRPDHRESGGTP
jgi:ABC-2 type transport system ATP-binding protein